MSIPAMPATHTWVQLGPGLSKAGRAALFAADTTQVWVWDEDTDTAITDLIDADGNPTTTVPVKDGWAGTGNPPGVGIPVAVKVVSFSTSQGGKRMATLPVQTLRDAASAIAPTDTQVATLLGNAASETRAQGDVVYAPITGSAEYATKTTVAGKVAKGDLVVNVRDYGATGNGTTDDTTAIGSAITAAGASGIVYFPPGRYLTGPLTQLSAQTWVGPTQQVGFSTTPSALVFTGLTGTQVGITMGTSGTLRNLRLEGPGAVAQPNAVAVSSTSPTARLYSVQTWKWGTGLSLASTWYAVVEDCEFRWGAVGVKLNNCYNANFYSTMWNCTIDGGATFGSAIVTTSSCMFNLHGCSVEAYGTQTAPGVKLSSSSSMACFGTYFESTCTNAVGILVDSLTGFNVSLTGCQVYLDYHSNWFQGWAGSPTGTLSSRGCRFVGGTTGGTNPIAFAYANPPTFAIDLASDDWSGVTNASALYRRDTNATPNTRIRDPHTAGTWLKKDREHMGRSLYLDGASWVASGNGVTANRPTTPATGAMWYDATLGKPIWWNGTVWKDAAGTTV